MFCLNFNLLSLSLFLFVSFLIEQSFFLDFVLYKNYIGWGVALFLCWSASLREPLETFECIVDEHPVFEDLTFLWYWGRC